MAGTIVFAGTGSGLGKTTITCGILYDLIQRGLHVKAFKCGPDYIDPMFHREVIGASSYNLDSFFLDEKELADHYKEHAQGCDVCVVEGVMGYYDGAGFTTKGSTYEIAGIIEAPVILIVDGRGMGNSIGAVISGFKNYCNPSGICGVIVNQVSAPAYEKMKGEILKQGLVPCGYLPRLKQELIFESRHLGLILTDETEDLKNRLEELWKVMRETVDMDRILKIAMDNQPDGPVEQDITTKDDAPGKVRIAVAKDEAFSFIYQENMETLQKLGCELVYFSPLHDGKLPENIQGIILSGGYPELHAAVLSHNQGMIDEVRKAIQCKIPLIAECGGYMYLKESIEDAEGRSYPMVGILPGVCKKSEKLVRFGYITMCAGRDNVLGRAGTTLKAHEFHYWDSPQNGDSYSARNTNGATYSCVYTMDNIFAGFPHLYYPANMNAIRCFVRACEAWGRQSKKEIEKDM